MPLTGKTMLAKNMPKTYEYDAILLQILFD